MPNRFRDALARASTPLRLVVSRGLILLGIYIAFEQSDFRFSARNGLSGAGFQGSAQSSLLILIGLLISPDVHVPRRMRAAPRNHRSLVGGIWRDATQNAEERYWTMAHVSASLSAAIALRPFLGDWPMLRLIGGGFNLLPYGLSRAYGHRRFIWHYLDIDDPELRGREPLLVLRWLGNLLAAQIASLGCLCLQVSNTQMLQQMLQQTLQHQARNRHVLDQHVLEHMNPEAAQLPTLLLMTLYAQGLRQMLELAALCTPQLASNPLLRLPGEFLQVAMVASTYPDWHSWPILWVEGFTTHRWNMSQRAAYMRGMPVLPAEDRFRLMRLFQRQQQADLPD